MNVFLGCLMMGVSGVKIALEEHENVQGYQHTNVCRKTAADPMSGTSKDAWLLLFSQKLQGTEPAWAELPL